MIEKITFKKNIKHSLSFISNLPSIEAMGREITFKKGLNIIVGPNGSGKSAILMAIGDAMAASQYGESCLSKSYLMEYASTHSNKQHNEKTFNFPFDIVHDGQAVLYGDPKRTTGIVNGKADEEALREGLLEFLAIQKESSGEQANRRITPFFDVLMGQKSPPSGLGATFEVGELNDLYTDLVKTYVDEIFTAKIPQSQITVLLDEPESSLGMLNNILLWEKILKNPAVSEKFQIIMVSHSPEALNIDGANYIEMRKGYLNACRGLINGSVAVEDALTFASNLVRDLTKSEITMLKKINTSKIGEINAYRPSNDKISESLKRLEEVDFIESWSLDVTKKSSSAMERSRSRKIVSVYTLTAKGKQYLSMHLK